MLCWAPSPPKLNGRYLRGYCLSSVDGKSNQCPSLLLCCSSISIPFHSPRSVHSLRDEAEDGDGAHEEDGVVELVVEFWCVNHPRISAFFFSFFFSSSFPGKKGGEGEKKERKRKKRRGKEKNLPLFSTLGALRRRFGPR